MAMTFSGCAPAATEDKLLQTQYRLDTAVLHEQATAMHQQCNQNSEVQCEGAAEEVTSMRSWRCWVERWVASSMRAWNSALNALPLATSLQSTSRSRKCSAGPILWHERFLSSTEHAVPSFSWLSAFTVLPGCARITFALVGVTQKENHEHLLPAAELCKVRQSKRFQLLLQADPHQGTVACDGEHGWPQQHL